MAVRAHLLGVEHDDLVGLGFGNGRATVPRVAFLRAAIFGRSFGVGFERFLGRRRRRAEISLIDFALLIPQQRFEASILLAQTSNLLLESHALRTDRRGDRKKRFLRGALHVIR